MFQLADEILDIGEKLQRKLNYMLEDVQKKPKTYFPLLPQQDFLKALEEDAIPLDPEEPKLIQPKQTGEQTATAEDTSRSIKLNEELEVYRHREEFLKMLEKHQVLVVSGETGCGKTTKLPQFVLDFYQRQNQGSRCNIVCTQPRRLSAIMVAKRVAEEQKQKLGENVGYKVRLDKRPPRNKNGSILFCTTGILLQHLKSSSDLEEYSHVFLDEAHERSVETDFLLIIMKDLVQRRKNLRVVLMSASMDQGKFAQYFGGCPILEIQGGRKFHIQNYYLEDIVDLVMEEKPTRNFRNLNRDFLNQTEEEKETYEKFHRDLEENNRFSEEQVEALKTWPENTINMKLIHRLINFICQKDRSMATGPNHTMGAILIFLPGWHEIQTLKTELEKHKLLCPAQIHVLHSMMPFSKQVQDVLDESPPPSVCKIILATNIAETSITIKDVVYIIDCGKANTARYSAEKDFNTLAANWVSKANAIQRAGRAGRVRDGECFRLFTSARYSLMSDHIEPEICHLRLEVLCLRIKNLQLGPIIPFLEKALSVPPLENVKNSIQFLKTLNALSPSEELTPLGHHLAKLPLDPQTGKMIILGAIFSCLDPILTIAASLAERDFFHYTQDNVRDVETSKRILGDKLNSDHLLVARAFQQFENKENKKERKDFCKIHSISYDKIYALCRFRKQLFEDLVAIGFLKKDEVELEHYNKNKDNDELLRAIICAGLYPNIAKASNARNSGSKQAVTLKQGTGFIHKKSSVCQAGQMTHRWAVFYQSMKQKDILLYDVTYVNPLAMILFSKDLAVRKSEDRATIEVDGWAEVLALPATATLLEKLRGTLNQVLNYRFQVPGLTDWQHEGKVLKSIINLLRNHRDHISDAMLTNMLDFC